MAALLFSRLFSTRISAYNREGMVSPGSRFLIVCWPVPFRSFSGKKQPTCSTSGSCRKSLSYSVFIDRKEVRNGTSVGGVLNNISKEKVKEMREKVIEYIPRIVYANNNEGLEVGMKDAFDLALEGFLRRVSEKKQQGGNAWKRRKLS